MPNMNPDLWRLYLAIFGLALCFVGIAGIIYSAIMPESEREQIIDIIVDSPDQWLRMQDK